MGDIFYRTYPKKLNKDKSNLGFLDIYDLDFRFMIGKILGIGYIIIEDIFDYYNQSFINYFQINKLLGHRRDFENQILKAHNLGIKIILRMDLGKILDKNQLINILNFWKEREIDGFLFDDFESLSNNRIFPLLKKDYKFIINSKENKYKFFSSVNLSRDFDNLDFKSYILGENNNDMGFSLYKDRGFYPQRFLDFKHFHINCAKLLAIISILRKENIFIKEGEETLFNIKEIKSQYRKEIFDFYKKLILLRYDYIDIINGGYFSLNFKDKDVLAYLYYKKNNAFVIINNLSQKNILLKLPSFLDVRNSKFVVGNISKREIFENINLRSYESCVFTCPISKI